MATSREPPPQAENRLSLFTASDTFVLFDYFRVPYELDRAAGSSTSGEHPSRRFGTVRSSVDGERALYWARAGAIGADGVGGVFELGDVRIAGRMIPDRTARAWLGELGGTWTQTEEIRDGRGARVASLWSDRNGCLFLPFDPNETIEQYWCEGYLDVLRSALGRVVRSRAERLYYLARPAMPRAAQIAVRRLYSRVQSKPEFPRWPVETALHDLYAVLLRMAGSLVDEPLPILSIWPDEYRWAFVLTHDVESTEAVDDIALLRDVEERASFLSSWNFVPENHDGPGEALFDQLRAGGFEIGVHGLRHDGRDITEMDERRPTIKAYADRWNAVGFRSPATLRDHRVMSRLPFEYDSSYSDSAPYEPQPGGCCSWLPYMIGDVVELPITLPQDHTLFEILRGRDDERLWVEKASFLRERGGLALVLTHPDYAHNPRLVDAYAALLQTFETDATAWKALPREVSTWWRNRAASHLERASGGWKIIGPAAARGSITLLGASGDAGGRHDGVPAAAGESIGSSQSSRHIE